MFWKQKEKKDLGNRINNNDITITRYLTDGLLAFNDKNRLFLVNPKAEKFLKVKEEDILGKSVLELNKFAEIGKIISALGVSLEECFRKEVFLEFFKDKKGSKSNRVIFRKCISQKTPHYYTICA